MDITIESAARTIIDRPGLLLYKLDQAADDGPGDYADAADLLSAWLDEAVVVALRSLS